ncbi:AfsR/SARP family transcriptional regulator [Lentzea cavernae]|uniref:AfsR/SARP family transcriptional regulator n=1 Tax=Lentzea cavernae TaxID=2020703 RepID=UPI001748ECC1|nr:BTAD domain-containing putative transcriptional regulator [Lentzea cavernae]
MELRVLGQVEVLVDGRPVEIGHARQRCVLAVLLVDANRVVTVEQLLDRVWAERLPHRARQVATNYVSRLRRVLAGGAEIARLGGGYVLRVDPEDVDLHRFRRLVGQAREREDALELLEEAAGLWRGEAFEGVDSPWIAAVRESLARERFAADADRVDLALAQGGHAALITELVGRADAHPLDERVAGQLMLALHRNGRQADALARFDDLRARLADELGADPRPELRDLHQRILATSPARATAADVPRQLPAPPEFTGRAEQLALLDKTLLGSSGTVPVAVVAGAGGIGKTWLALHWAHRHADEFPDGQLFADLRGFGPADPPLAPDAVLFGFLTALGVAPDRVPTGLDAKAASYRSLVAGRRMLVVLDNAAGAGQVVPLIPGSPACTVLVTGRHRLASLIDRYGARHLPLGALTRDEGRGLLVTRLGADRVAAEPAATDDLVDLCGGYPLALSIAVRNAVTDPATTLAEVAAQLRDLGLAVLDHATDPAASLPAVLSWSLRRLTGEQRTAFGLLGIAPGPDITAPAVAALTGSSAGRAHHVLAALVEASLVEQRPHGRYGMHDLVRDFAATTAETADEAGLARVADFYLHTAHAADVLLDPHRSLVRPGPPAAGVRPLPLPDAEAAMAWLEAEHATLLATQRTAGALGRHEVVWHLARALDTFHYRRGHRHDALTSWRAALDAAGHLPDPTTRIRTHRYVGSACSRCGLLEEATDHLDQALALALRHNDSTEQAHTHLALTTVWERRRDDRRAYDHARQALALYRTLSQPAWEADGLNSVGWFAARLGDFDTAREHCEAALELHRRHRHPIGEADTLDSLGFIAHSTGDHGQAVGHYRRALTLFRAHGDSYQVANTADNLGHAHAALGQREQAGEVWWTALELYREQDRAAEAARVRQRLTDLGEPRGGPPS